MIAVGQGSRQAFRFLRGELLAQTPQLRHAHAHDAAVLRRGQQAPQEDGVFFVGELPQPPAHCINVRIGFALHNSTSTGRSISMLSGVTRQSQAIIPTPAAAACSKRLLNAGSVSKLGVKRCTPFIWMTKNRKAS